MKSVRPIIRKHSMYTTSTREGQTLNQKVRERTQKTTCLQELT